MVYKIRFSHDYEKFYTLTGTPLLPPNKEAMLMEVFNAQSTSLGDTFKYYDSKIKNGGHYELPQGEILILLFRTPESFFTTIRSWSAEKERYYRSLRGTVLKIDIQETEEKDK